MIIFEITLSRRNTYCVTLCHYHLRKCLCKDFCAVYYYYMYSSYFMEALTLFVLPLF